MQKKNKRLTLARRRKGRAVSPFRKSKGMYNKGFDSGYNRGFDSGMAQGFEDGHERKYIETY